MFQARLKECADQVAACLAGVFAEFEDVPVVRAMAHATHGGKRVRAFLVMESARLCGVEDGQSVWAAAAVEAMHGYSLVHDDLPCMDDDAARRGQPTVHVKWDEATAVLAGDALQALAFELLARAELAHDPAVRLALSGSLARAVGGGGMVLGQAQDIAAETADTPLTLEQITRLQTLKTGALIQWSCSVGPVMAGVDGTALAGYAQALGLAFQIADDMLDATGDAKLVGKRVGKDARAGKATFVSLLGLENAGQLARENVAQASAMLLPYGKRANVLQQAASFVISRNM